MNENNSAVTSVAITDVPTHEKVPVLGITSRPVTGSVRRADLVGRLILTEQVGFGIGEGERLCCIADCSAEDRKRVLWTVKKPEAPVKAWVRTSTGQMSFADGFDFAGDDVYTSFDKDNTDVKVIYISSEANLVTLSTLVKCASGMVASDAASCGYWKIVDAEGRRIFIRTYVPVSENGKAVDVD